MADNKLSLENAKYVMSRYDHYFDAINNKAQFYLALNTLILGAIITCVPVVKSSCKMTFVLIFLIAAFAIVCIISLVFTLLAIKPFLANGHSEDGYKSLIFFDSIAKQNRNDFANQFSVHESFETDLLYQIHQLARGLSYKYHKMKWASWMLFIDIIIFILISLIILNNILL